MTIDHAAEVDATVAVAPEILPGPVRGRIFLYLSALIFLLAFGGPIGGLIDIPISFFLKNKLHLRRRGRQFPPRGRDPLYLSWVFGFLRDVWSPFGMGDRGYMMLFGGRAPGSMSPSPSSPSPMGRCSSRSSLLTASFLFVASAQNGLTATMGQQHVMSGQISAVWNVVSRCR